MNQVMPQSTRTPFPEDGLEPARELALVGAEGAGGSEAESVSPRRRPRPTLHLAAHEIIRFAPPAEREHEAG